MKLTGNTILITGGTSGIGYELAGRFLALGNTVIVTGRNQKALDAVKTTLPALYTFQSDVADPVAITQLSDAVKKQFPDLNILINNAGEMRKLSLLDPAVDQEEVTGEIAINLMGPIRMVQQFLPQLLTKANGAILNVTSGLAFVPFAIAPIYGATKSGLRAYTLALRIQLKDTEIKVFELVAPAANTPLNDKFGAAIDSKMLMEPAKLVDDVIKAMRKDKLEIYPGMAGMIRIMSHIAPRFLLNQMSKAANKSLSTSN